MTEQQQREACAELARRMGWQFKVNPWLGKAKVWHSPDNIPDNLPSYFTDHAALRELVAWLAKQEVVIKRRFIANLHPGLSDACVFNDAPIDEDMILEALTAEPSVIARAACKALGIKVSE